MSRHAVATVALALAAAAPSGGQTLDQKAWDAVWDRLEKVLPRRSDNELVHVLPTLVPATWAKRDDDSLVELQRIAGAIPDETFTIDPSIRKLLLHNVYASFVADVELPLRSAEERRAYAAASEAYQQAFDAYLARLDQYLARWERRQADLTARNQPIDSVARMRFRNDNRGFFRQVQAALDDAFQDVQRFAPVALQWSRAVQELQDELDNAKSDLRGMWHYEGSFATLTSVMTECAEDGPGWEKLTFSRSMQSERTRTSDWNAGGSWGGSFFSIGGDGRGSNYDHVLRTADDAIELRFCNLVYLPLSPGNWFDISLLQAIDQGLMTLKSDSPNHGRRILGPDGQIPRLVKGAIIARSVQLEARLATSQLEEYKRSVSGSGGVRIGPFRIGGGGGSTEFRREYDAENGGYVRSTNMDVPVVLAVVTESTGAAEQQTAAAGAQDGQGHE